MHILITGAAGMIGRKLVARLVAAGALNGKPIDKLTLIDVSAPQKPQGFHRQRREQRRRYRRCRGGACCRRRPARRDLPSRRGGVRRGGARFRERRPRQSRRLARAHRSDPRHGRRLSPAPGLHLFDRGVRRAVSGNHRRRLSPNAAHLLRHPEGHRRIAACRLHPPRLFGRHRHPAAEHRGAAGPAEQGGVRFLLFDHPRAA